MTRTKREPEPREGVEIDPRFNLTMAGKQNLATLGGMDGASRREMVILREGEEIGGGWFVGKRSSHTGRLYLDGFPFEHPTAAAATIEARRLADRYPGTTYVILEQRAGIITATAPDLVPEVING